MPRIHLSPAVAAGASALCALLAVTSFVLRSPEVHAGDYHDRGTLACGECHVMHAPGASSSGAGSSGARASLGAGRLLRRDVNELCLSCHDGSARAADVLGANQGSAPSVVRQAGFLNALGGAGLAATGHTLGSTDVAPGSIPPWSASDEPAPGRGLTCIHCHSPHGTQDGGQSTWRNLRSDAGNNPAGRGLVTYNDGTPGTNDLRRDVFQRRARGYGEADVDFNEPDRTDSGIGRFCAGCHGEFHGRPIVDANIGGAVEGGRISAFSRHPVAGIDLGPGGFDDEEGGRSSAARFLSHKNRVKVMSSLGAWDAPATLTPTCITCHKAHGNGNPFGLIFRSGRGTPTEDGDSGGSAVEDLCRQCHGPSPFAP